MQGTRSWVEVRGRPEVTLPRTTRRHLRRVARRSVSSYRDPMSGATLVGARVKGKLLCQTFLQGTKGLLQTFGCRLACIQRRGVDVITVEDCPTAPLHCRNPGRLDLLVEGCLQHSCGPPPSPTDSQQNHLVDLLVHQGSWTLKLPS